MIVPSRQINFFLSCSQQFNTTGGVKGYDNPVAINNKDNLLAVCPIVDAE